MIFTEHFHLKATEYTFFSRAHGTFFRIDDILEHIISLGKFKKIDIISSIFSNQNATKLEMNSKEKKNLQKANTWKLNNMLLNNQLINEEIKR